MPVTKLFVDSDDQVIQSIIDIRWEGSIKPELTGREAVNDGRAIYEEIQFFHINLNDRTYNYDVAHRLFQSIPYPCVLELQWKEAICIAVCSFKTGKRDDNKNVINAIIFSHWIRKSFMSDDAEDMLNSINCEIKKQTDLKELYDNIRSEVSNFQFSGTSKTHVEKVLKILKGGMAIYGLKPMLRDDCPPSRFYSYKNLYEKYRKDKRSLSYKLIYDYEEVWYVFMQFPEMRKIIERRRFRDVEDMFYQIDSMDW